MTANLTGGILIGGSSVEDREKHHRATNPTTGAPIETPFAFATRADVDRACELAAKAFDEYRAIDLERRARFLEAIAQEILNIGDVLIETAMAESGLTRPRLEGERGRTVGQLRMFAALVRDGEWLDLRIDPAQPERKPAPRVDLRLRQLPLGPVAVFGASNFPLAFSVAGGDTASALAAGCPVVVKGHPAHPATGELVGRAIQRAVESSKMPAGVFSLLLGAIETGQQLVQNPHIKAVGFTGSRGGGLALVALAAARPEPIPVFAEMSSINPVFLLPAALAERGPAIAKAFVGSVTLGAGQFCTNPGLLFAVDGPDLNGFLDAVRANLEGHSPEPMLTPGIHSAFEQGVRAFEGHSAVVEVARGQAPNAPVRGQSRVFATDSASFLAHEDLRNEVFGAAALVVRCRDAAELPKVAEHLEGQLTATLQLAPADYDVARTLIPVLERKVGRILANGWPTGVEVGHAMVHGGPFPATSDSRATSVGSLAIRRFLRPVSYQDLPAELIPTELANANPLGLSRLVDGVRMKEATGQPAR